ncbi:MAG: pyridoxal-phosphate dependent enzyme [Nitrospirae bacterium]|nr:pyridoxal-phosphate dependent enzyme [Nitrospirota bacterium]
MKKFSLVCNTCSKSFNDFVEWFASNQVCPDCGGQYVEAIYENLIERLIKNFVKNKHSLKGMWRYYDILPLNSERNIVTAGEGNVSIDRWHFLEAFAKQYFNVSCQVYVHRNDNNNATGSFKDLAGSLVASVLQENNIQQYVVASTGNIGVAFSRYISRYNGTLYVFIPEHSPLFKEAEISIFGQRVYRVMGDYAAAKSMAEAFSREKNILSACGAFDPMRVEAKKTMALEWFRQLDYFPDVYIQALSGGTGPIGVIKGCRELITAKMIKKLPRLILVQTSRCAPMAEAWNLAKSMGFPDGWQKRYPVYDNPDTGISTLATGNPSAYPVLSNYIKESNGDIIDFPEDIVNDLARVIASETSVRLGPAAVVAVGGYFNALKKGLILKDDHVLINLGEGIRRDPEFMVQLNKKSIRVSRSGECTLFDRAQYKNEIWSGLRQYILGPKDH